MLLSRIPSLLTLFIVSTLTTSPTDLANNEEQQHLHLTAVVSLQGAARFQCWRITEPFVDYPTIGKTIPNLAQVSNVSYVVLPPQSSEGLHKPPHPMLFVLLSGAALVTLGGGHGELWIIEGINGMVVAADGESFGHYTSYPSDKYTVALQIPFEDGVLPEHTVVKEGACGLDIEGQRRRDEVVGRVRGLQVQQEGQHVML